MTEHINRTPEVVVRTKRVERGLVNYIVERDRSRGFRKKAAMAEIAKTGDSAKYGDLLRRLDGFASVEPKDLTEEDKKASHEVVKELSDAFGPHNNGMVEVYTAWKSSEDRRQ